MMRPIRLTDGMMATDALVGIGLYTPAEAERLIHVRAGKISRWLRGHSLKGQCYEPLWQSQVDLGDNKIYLGFRDLMEMRAANAFIEAGVSAIMVRRAIIAARELVGDAHPLSTTKFRTDGRAIFLEVARIEGDATLMNIFNKQFAFKAVMEQSLKDIEFDGVAPSRWWPATRSKGIIVDPARSFGQPIEQDSGIPTSILAAARKAEGSIAAAAHAWQVRPISVSRAVEFEETFAKRAA